MSKKLSMKLAAGLLGMMATGTLLSLAMAYYSYRRCQLAQEKAEEEKARDRMVGEGGHDWGKASEVQHLH